MIIGNGDIAGVIPDKVGYLFFASGVSNSKEKRESEYTREKTLLLSQNKKAHLVYFGSLCIFYNPTTRYAQHKREMESLVKKHFRNYTIVRIGNIDWGKNPHTLINFFKNEIHQGRKITIADTYRFIVDKEEFLYWIELIPEYNCEINIPGKRMKVLDVVKKYVK